MRYDRWRAGVETSSRRKVGGEDDALESSRGIRDRRDDRSGSLAYSEIQVPRPEYPLNIRGVRMS